MNLIKPFLITTLLGLPLLLHAQLSNRDALPLDSIVALAAEEQNLSLVPVNELPASGTFWLMSSNGLRVPFPMLPADLSAPVYDLGDGTFLVDNTQGQIAVPPGQTVAQAANTQANAVMDFIAAEQEAAWERVLVKALGLEESQDTNGFSSVVTTVQDTNGLWLEINKVANGQAQLNLHQATNWVYAIWSKTDLLSGWQMEAELWPTDTNSFSFSVPTAGRPNLFLRAEDWTEADSRGAGVPDWWQWYWFGELTGSATNLDDLGNTYWLDFALGLDPNVIQFALTATNNYWRQVNVPVTANLGYGQPSYYAVLVDDTNYLHAAWHTYTGPNLTVNLGLNEGWHDVQVGLRGHADRPDQGVWQWKRLKLDYTAPQIVITNPTNAVVDIPLVQIQGYSPESLQSISYDLTNAAGWLTNQQVLVLNQTYSTNTWEFTTNTFQAFDVWLTNGVNTFTFHATDLAGNVTTFVTNFTLDYSGKTNPPSIQVTWPQDGTQVSGNSLTVDGLVSDATVNVTASTTDANGNTNTLSGLVERSGRFWVQNVPLNSGTNAVTLIATDAAGNTTTTNFVAIKSPVTLTVNPVTPDSQLWQARVNLTGTISDTSYAVWVNGVKGHNNGNGTWSASNVPVDAGGTASFTATGYAPSEQQPDGSYGN